MTYHGIEVAIWNQRSKGYQKFLVNAADEHVMHNLCRDGGATGRNAPEIWQSLTRSQFDLMLVDL